MDTTIIVGIISAIVAIFTNASMWNVVAVNRRFKKNTNELLMGMAHNTILDAYNKYTERGYITPSEIEDLVKYVWIPYSQQNGNGTGEEMINKIKKLPMKPDKN